jgi:hypothetical protein
MQIPFFNALEASRRVLLAGCGGGFDVVSALPLYIWLTRSGRAVFLANLSFSHLALACREKIGPSAWVIDPKCAPMSYFPERHLADWLARRGEIPRLIGFEKTGVRPLQKSYEAVVERLGIDTIVLVDGGTDSLIKGDEALLGTVEEDAASIVAVDQLANVAKYLVCLGFGIDFFHGISHHSFLENTAELIRQRGYLGSVSVVSGTPEGDGYLDAVAFLNERQPGLN